MSWLILVSSLIISISTATVLGAALGLTGLILLHFQAGGATALAVTAVWNVFSDFTLSAVPLFILLGDILLASGISTKIYNGLTPLFHKIPGKLLHTNIAVSTVFGAVSGSSSSTAAAIGSVGYPELSKRGYHRPLIVGSLAAGGTLGLLIPPSLSLLIYGATQNVSIGKLFLAGIAPGILIGLFFSLYLVIVDKVKPGMTPTDTEEVSFGKIVKGLLQIWPLPILIFFVLGTIYLGFATPTEAAGLGVFISLVLGFSWGELTLRKLWGALVSTSFVFGAIAMIMLGTQILAQAVSILGLPRELVNMIGDYELSKYTVLVLVILVYLVLGCFFDGISLLFMTLPITTPIMINMGFDPIWFGVIVTILMEIGMITPPVGLNLFVLVTIAGREVDLGEAAWATLPFWFIMMGTVGLFTIFPQLILFIPDFY